MAVEHWIFPRNDRNCLYGFSFGIGFCPSAKQIAKQRANSSHVSNQQHIFKKDKMNNSSGVMSPRLFFLVCVFFNIKCHFD